MNLPEIKHFVKWKLYYLRCELIYFLGGIPREHINTLHYRNIESVIGGLRADIEKANN